jgi:hypothetical protein
MLRPDSSLKDKAQDMVFWSFHYLLYSAVKRARFVYICVLIIIYILSC